jgi:hypothetical protein
MGRPGPLVGIVRASPVCLRVGTVRDPPLVGSVRTHPGVGIVLAHSAHPLLGGVRARLALAGIVPADLAPLPVAIVGVRRPVRRVRGHAAPPLVGSVPVLLAPRPVGTARVHPLVGTAHLAPLLVGVVPVRGLVGMGRVRPARPPVGIVPVRPARPLVGIAHPRPRVGDVPARPAPPRVGIVPAPSAPARPAPSRRAGEREQAAPVVRRVAGSPQVVPDRAGVRPTTGRRVALGRAGVRPATRRHPAHGVPAWTGSQAGDGRPGTIRGTEASGRRRRRGRPGDLVTAIGSRRVRGRSMARRVEGPRGRQVEGAGGRRAEGAGERRQASPGRPTTGSWNGRAARVARAMARTRRGRYDSTRR